MSIEKQTAVNKIEVLENGVVQVQFIVKIIEDGQMISGSYHRTSFAPGQDVSIEDQKIKDVCAAVWTEEVVANYQKSTAAQGV